MTDLGKILMKRLILPLALAVTFGCASQKSYIVENNPNQTDSFYIKGDTIFGKDWWRLVDKPRSPPNGIRVIAEGPCEIKDTIPEEKYQELKDQGFPLDGVYKQVGDSIIKIDSCKYL